MKDLIKIELIGLNVEVIDSKNKSNIGLHGKIIDETKATLTIEKNKQKKQVFKNNIILNLKINNKIIKINGNKLIGRPKERIKNG